MTCDALLLTIVALGMVLVRPQGKVAAVSDVLVPADPAGVKLTGFLGRRVEASARERLPLVDEDELLAGFEHRPGSHPWIGEHVGKWLTAAGASARGSGDAALTAKVERVARRLMTTQEKDGYLGTYLPADRFQLKPGADWDVWVHKYAILGLLAYHDLSGDADALAAASRAAALLARTFGPGGRSLVGAGTHMGMAATSVLEPIVKLAEVTGDQELLAFARHIVASYDDAGGPRLLASLLAGTPVDRVANAKAYEMLSNLVGLCELHRATGERSYLDACLHAWGDVVKNRLYPTGGSSSGEHFQPEGTFPRGPEACIAETCVTTTWIQLNAQLLRLTGDSRFADEIERAAYNHLLAAQRPTGEAWCYYTPLEGRKPYGNETSCCLSSGPRALALLPALAVMQESGGSLFVNLFEPGRYRLGEATLEIETDYPYGGKVTVRADRALRLGLRVPAFAAGHARVLEHALQIERGYAMVDAGAGERLVLELPMDVTARSIAGDPTRAYVQRGPLVFAASERFNPATSVRLLEIEPATIRFALEPLDPARADFAGQQVLRGEGLVRYPLDRAPVRVPLVLTDFAHTGTRLERYEAALLIGQASRFALAAESSSRCGNVNGHFNDEDATTYCVTHDGTKRDVDWFALTLASESPGFDRVIYHHGATFHDGGWFDASRAKPWLEVQRGAGGPWEKLASFAGYPATTAADAAGLAGGEAFTIDLPAPVRACAIRVAGHPARGDQDRHSFASCAELRAVLR
jgi:DUF1680 family protein